jgi:hypothetical protein|tara:strand:+ start:1973 stop:2371 length:399 start_codon:yes stop_codon:yes gene_type:complete
VTDKDPDPIDQFIALTRSKRELDEQVKRANKQLAVLEEILVEQFLADGTESTKRDGMTLSRKNIKTIKAVGGDYKRIAQIFLNLGMPEMVSTHSRTLQGYVAELIRNEAEIPEVLAQAIEVGEVNRIGARES